MAGDLRPPAPPLAKTIYAGLAITTHHPTRITEARFSNLEIREQ
jgi:hypothetical protein